MRRGRKVGRWFRWVLAVSLFVGVAGACNTVKGIGKDIRSLGGAIERSASGGR